jgi:hypothetical protein
VYEINVNRSQITASRHSANSIDGHLQRILNVDELCFWDASSRWSLLCGLHCLLSSPSVSSGPRARYCHLRSYDVKVSTNLRCTFVREPLSTFWRRYHLSPVISRGPFWFACRDGVERRDASTPLDEQKCACFRIRKRRDSGQSDRYDVDETTSARVT